MNLKAISLLINLLQNTFLWIGIMCAIFHFGVFNTALGGMLFTPDWLITMKNINSATIWAMVVFGGKESIKFHNRFKKSTEVKEVE